MADPFTIGAIAISSISLGLKLLDQFQVGPRLRSSSLPLIGRGSTPPTPNTDTTPAAAEAAPTEQPSGPIDVRQVGEKIQIVQGETVIKEVNADDVNLTAWDQTRYDSLLGRLERNWVVYNDIYRRMVNTSIDEKIRLEGVMEERQQEICADLWEMKAMIENALAFKLPESYALDKLCGPGYRD